MWIANPVFDLRNRGRDLEVNEAGDKLVGLESQRIDLLQCWLGRGREQCGLMHGGGVASAVAMCGWHQLWLPRG